MHGSTRGLYFMYVCMYVYILCVLERVVFNSGVRDQGSTDYVRARMCHSMRSRLLTHAREHVFVYPGGREFRYPALKQDATRLKESYREILNTAAGRTGSERMRASDEYYNPTLRLAMCHAFADTRGLRPPSVRPNHLAAPWRRRAP